MKLNELLEEYEELSDWGEQCDFLIDLGRDLPPLPEEDHTDCNIVHGCQSRVWLTTELDAAMDPPTVKIQADSDALIVKGLIAVLLAAYAEKTPVDILETDIAGLFERMGLHRQLSSSRRNGLYGMVERIRSFAARSLSASVRTVP